METYLLVDFGSTYTKLSLIDRENCVIVGRVSSHTTVKTNINEGFNDAMKKLKAQVDIDKCNIVETLACSSAGGGLKMISIGITPHYTVEAAKSAALGAGARLLKTFSYRLSEEDVREIEDLKPDIILLTGGAEFGNVHYIIHNAKMLCGLKSKTPIVVAGNSSANGEVKNIFDNCGVEYEITENVMPDINRINPEPVREVIRQMFMKQIMFAKGMEDVEEIVDELIMPTPTAVLKAAELLARGTDSREGYSEVIVVDIGGATTDIHSVSKPVKDKGFIYDGLEEPYLKRTVEGDLGMRYSAVSLYENIGEEGFKKYDSEVQNIYERCVYRHNNPEIVFEDASEKEFDEIIAKNCAGISMKRHAGRVRPSYMNGKNILVQNGKDLRDTNMVIGTGGIIINSVNSVEILDKIESDDVNMLQPQAPNYYVDKNYILSAMGLLSTREPELAFKILVDNLEYCKS